MNPRAIFTVWTKELRDSIRDKRTLISTLVIPALIVPVISLVAITITSKIVNKAKAEVPPVMILGGADSPRVVELLKAHPKFRCVPPSADWKVQISEKKVQAVIEVPEAFDAKVEKGEPAELRLYHYEGELRSGFAVNELRRVAADYREKVVSARLVERGLPVSLMKPFEIRMQNVAPPEKVGGNIIGGIIPYVFILFCFTGCLYPAIDLTAGEKERGTMETILCSPISRIDLVLGKFLMVLTAALATVVCSLASMIASFLVGGALLASEVRHVPGPGGLGGAPSVLPTLDPVGFFGVIGLMLPMAAFFAALLLAISLTAKSTKEAQSLVSPLIVVIIMPAMVGMLPGVELNVKLALVPILNLALACKEMLSGVWHWQLLALIFTSSCVYAAAALAFCVRQFNREDVLFRN